MLNQEHQNISGVPHIQNPHGEPVGRTVLFVSDLADNVTEADLDIFFQEFKDSIIIVQINRVTRQNETRPNINGTVIFRDSAKADMARKALNLRKVKGKTIRIMWHERDNSVRYNNQGNLFIKNIPVEVKPREFFEFFLAFGDIVSAKLCEDEEGNHYGYGYVHFTSDESAQAALEHCEKNKAFNATLDVKYFQKKNERLNPMSGNKNVYVKNITMKTTEQEVRTLFSKHGVITWMKLVEEKENQRQFAIISYDIEESTNKAITNVNGTTLDGNELYVDTLQKKSDRKKLLTTKISDNNFRLNTKFKNCNLHIRNIPFDCTEEYLNEAFGKFGEIQSIKIQKYILVTKVNNEFKEFPMSRGFGYVCFTTEENAKSAREAYNGKFLPKYESWKRPILIEFFMPRGERQNVYSRLQQQFNPNTQKKLPFFNPATPQNFNFMNPMMYPMGLHPNLAKHIKYPTMHMNNTNQGYVNKSVAPRQPNNQTNTSRNEEPDVNYMNSLDDDVARKDYLGEFIFKKIENHEFTQRNNMTIDTIGKITGMILGIEDLNEIIEISKSFEQLTMRITEALELLEGVSK